MILYTEIEIALVDDTGNPGVELDFAPDSERSPVEHFADQETPTVSSSSAERRSRRRRPTVAAVPRSVLLR